MFGKEILLSGVRLGCLKSLRIHEQPWSAGWKLSQFSGHLCPQTWDTVSESVGKLMTTLQTCSIQEMEIMCMKIPPLGSVCSSAVQGWNSKSVPSLCAALFCPCSDLLSHFQPQYCLVKNTGLFSQCQRSDLAQKLLCSARDAPAAHLFLLKYGVFVTFLTMLAVASPCKKKPSKVFE